VWEEYIAGEPGGYRYSRFCELYRAWEGRLSVTMRQSYGAGDKPSHVAHGMAKLRAHQ
jgi:transposase